MDIIPIIARVIGAYMDPVKLTENALDALIGTTFINDVDLPTLGAPYILSTGVILLTVSCFHRVRLAGSHPDEGHA